MSKNVKRITMVLAVLVIALVSLVGCVKFEAVPGGQPDAVTQNNSSNVVVQGDYIYFVNGFAGPDSITKKEDNEYGNVTKGAIYRAKKDGTDVKLLVPQLAYTANTKVGISVLGNYIYFGSPSTSKDKQGNLQTSFTDFYRVKLDGSDIEKITTVPTNTMEFKFTDKGLYYINDSKLMLIPFEGDKLGKEKIVAEKYDSIALGVMTTYDPKGVNISQYSAFTKTPEETDGKQFNIMYAVNAKGETKEIFNGKDKEIKYSIKGVEYEGDNMIILYEQTYKDPILAQKYAGLYAIKVDKDLNKVGEEVKYIEKNGLSYRFISYAEGVYAFDGSKMYKPAVEINENKKVEYDLGSIASSDILKIENENDRLYMYYTTGNGLSKIEMKKEGITDFTPNSQDNGFVANVEWKVKANVKTDGIKPVIIDNTFYYINTRYFNYLYVVDITKEDAKHSILGVRTEEDTKSYIKFVEDMSEEDRLEHDKLIAEDIKDIKPFDPDKK